MDEVSALRREIQMLRDELEAIKVTLDVVGTIDLDSGILNRTGVLDALERGQKWLIRRGDIYGLIVVAFPALSDEVLFGDGAVEFRTHVTATIGAAIREVDSVGRLNETTFAVALADLEPGTIEIVAARMKDLLDRLAASTPAMGGAFRISGVEVLSALPSGNVLGRALQLNAEADPGPVIARLE
ncbi:MAG: hypothetical protein WD532_11585 [Acidimicrobiia bacterium]